MRKMDIRAALLAAVCGIAAANAQVADISPLPQEVTWGDVAFARGDTAGVRIVRGCVGQKAVARYRKMVPEQAEGYYLRVTPTEVILAGRDETGLFRGEETLARIMEQPRVMQCEVRDWPSVECRGVIEGFYGNPWSHEDRLRQFEFYARRKLNTYVYGPKDDPYHRMRWREPYPEDEAARIRELAEAARKCRVEFVWALHPGVDIRWNLADSMAVVSKLESMYGLGVRTFAVFFDDIGGEGARGEKQAGLLNYVTDRFVRRHKDVKPLIMCPTQYNKGWSGGDYLSTLGTLMYPEVRIMWTGNSVVDMIERDDLEWINAQIRRKAFIWLNYPVNDYCQSRLLMGRTYGNGLDIADMVSGFCSNPMEYAEASKVSLYSIADYTWNMPAYDDKASWSRAVRELMPTCPDAFRTFCENNVDLGPTGHGLRREGESPLFRGDTASLGANLRSLVEAADELLADEVNHPEMLGEIKPWVRSMRLLARRGLLCLKMSDDLHDNDSVAFIGRYRAQAALEQEQKAIVSRDYEGSIVRARPVVSGDVITPWVTANVAAMVKAYRQRHAYGTEHLPVQAIADGEYFIIADGAYLTNAQAGADRTGDHPVFMPERDVINPQRQQWTVEQDVRTGRYRICNKQDGRYINERGTFWASKDINPYDSDWHTYVITPVQEGFTIQCGGRAGSSYWTPADGRITNAGEPGTFRLVPVK